MPNKLGLGRKLCTGEQLPVQWVGQRPENVLPGTLYRYKAHLVLQFLFGLAAISNSVMDKIKWIYLAVTGINDKTHAAVTIATDVHVGSISGAVILKFLYLSRV